VAVSPSGNQVYVTNFGTDTVSVLNATGPVVATIPVGLDPEGVSVTPSGARVYVANTAAGTTSVIDAATRTVIGTVTVGSSPGAFGQFIATPAP
jgi:YVTN family beta-propeller protein